MGKIDREGKDIVYRQDDGEITAYLTAYEEREAVTHEGKHGVRIVLYGFVAFAMIYLAMILFRHL